MISRYEAYMDGVPLSSLSENLLILDISHSAANIENRTMQFANRHGLYVYDRYKESASVTISFELHIYDIAQRQAVCQEVARWALNGKELQTNDRPGQRLRVVCDEPPVIESALGWTAAISMTFSGYIVPFWEEIVPAVAYVSNGDGTLFVPGNGGKTVVECTVEPVATITSITLGCGNTSITLSGISVSSSQTLKISYDDNMNLQIKRGNVSYLNKRTAASSDDLLAVCGQNNALTVTADQSVLATFSARGLWI